MHMDISDNVVKFTIVILYHVYQRSRRLEQHITDSAVNAMT